MLLPNITLTGIDVCTNVQSLLRHIHDKFSTRRFELAMLYRGRTGPEVGNRFVSLEFAMQQAEAVMHSEYNKGNITCALHVCGQARAEVLQNPEVFNHFDRVQVNGTFTEDELFPWLHRASLHDCGLVLQRFSVDSREHDRLLASVSHSNLSILQDASGGRGILNTDLRVYPKASAEVAVGFAGGFTPHNIYGAVMRCEVGEHQEWWLDLESGLRDECDYFCLSSAMECVDQFVKATERLDLKHELDRIISSNTHVKNDAVGRLLDLARLCLVTDKWPDDSLLNPDEVHAWCELMRSKQDPS